MQIISCNVFILFKKRQGNQSGGKENKTKGLKCKKQETRTWLQLAKDLVAIIWIRKSKGTNGGLTTH